jgi:hypothetical protein
LRYFDTLKFRSKTLRIYHYPSTTPPTECRVSIVAMSCLFRNGPNITMTEKSIIFGIVGNAITVLKPSQPSNRLMTLRHGTMFSTHCWSHRVIQR